MKKITLSTLSFLSLCGLTQADSLHVWKTAYQGNFSLTHKQMLLRPTEDVEDLIRNQFIMLYLAYRSEDWGQVIEMLDSVDWIIENAEIKP